MFITCHQEGGGTISQSYKRLVFSGGEIQINLNAFSLPFNETDKITIKATISNSDDVMELLMLTDALRRSDGMLGVPVHLIMPYMPYARQDRVMQSGESLSVKVFADLINAQNYASVMIYDAHSDVAPAVLDRCYSVPVEKLVGNIPNKIKENCIVVAPDAGAIKKVSKVAKLFGAEMVRADKTRDVTTGAINGTVVYYEGVTDKDFLIVDDICDGGRTFVELAKVLRPHTTGKVYLYVTHGIFSQGLDALAGIDHIYCAVPWPQYRDYNYTAFPVLTQLLKD